MKITVHFQGASMKVKFKEDTTLIKANFGKIDESEQRIAVAVAAIPAAEGASF